MVFDTFSINRERSFGENRLKNSCVRLDFFLLALVYGVNTRLLCTLVIFFHVILSCLLSFSMEKYGRGLLNRFENDENRRKRKRKKHTHTE